MRWFSLVCCCAVLPLALSGCSSHNGFFSSRDISANPSLVRPVVHDPALLGAGASKIQHVIVIMQENRSFDNLFNGFPGADTAQSGSNYGTTVQLQPLGLAQGADLYHGHPAFWADWDQGKMDGFAHARMTPFYYVPLTEMQPVWTLAQRFVLGDRTFQSNSGPSYPAHQYMIAGQSANADANPTNPQSLQSNHVVNQWGCDAPAPTTVALLGPNGTDLPGPYPCFNYQSIADLLDQKGVSWKYYAPKPTQSGYPWSAFDAIWHIRFGPDWTRNVITPDTQIFTDLQNGTLAQVNWVIPDFAYSDHAGPGATDEGPSWVADVVNAIGASKYWNDTAIFISWDDWGGWYDHVAPPSVDKMGLGFRVPLLVVSPYAKQGYISHQTHEFGSLLHFTEEVFALPSLNTRDAISDDLADCFNFNQQPLGYQQIPTKYSQTFFVNSSPSSKAPDDD